jgi:hypothetical protein
MSKQFEGQLEVDTNRGVVYFHDKETGGTVLRICGLTIPKDFSTMDLTHKNRILYESYTKGRYMGHKTIAFTEQEIDTIVAGDKVMTMRTEDEVGKYARGYYQIEGTTHIIFISKIQCLYKESLADSSIVRDLTLEGCRAAKEDTLVAHIIYFNIVRDEPSYDPDL